MNKETNKLIPEIRFPEFVNDGEWVDGPFESFCFNVSSGKDKNDIVGKYRLYGSTGIIGKSESGSYDGRFILVARVGANAGLLNKVFGKFGVTDNTLVIDLINKDLIDFIFYSLDKVELNKLVFGSGQPLITGGQLKSLLLNVPKNENEQQKIASCLSSLDEVIAAHSQKLELLKEHKKGLMQNLFPQEGETLPKYRFPEFVNNGEWEEKKLGSCLIQTPEYGLNAAAVPYSEKLPTYIRITDISENGAFLSNNKVSVDWDVSENNYLSEGDIVLARTGASVGKSYKYRKKDGKLVFAGFLIRVKPDATKLDSEFLFQFLTSSQYWNWVKFISARSGQPGINGTEYSLLPICLPPKLNEQQKIASCLSSLDALITAQAEKVEQLKLHKKGLMQGLFPQTA